MQSFFVFFIASFLAAIPLSSEYSMNRNGMLASQLYMELRNLPEAYSKSYLLPGLRPLPPNVVGEPPLDVNPNIKPAKARKTKSDESKLKKSERRKLSPPKRLYRLGKEELIISCNISTIMNPTNTRLVPPLTWLTAAGSKVKVLHSSRAFATSESAIIPQSKQDQLDLLDASESPILIKHSFLEIVVERSVVDSSLSTLKLNGFSRDDINRMVDKAPWILAFDLSKCVPKLFFDLQSDLRLTPQQAIHVISHCPYLVAQYARYKGRDVSSTAKALVEVGYGSLKLVDDVMRFPTILSCPPNRILGWQNLLAMFGIATAPGIFGKMLRKTPFMFYLNPPRIDDDEESEVAEPDEIDRIATTSDYVLRESLRVLRVLDSLALSDLDKVFRTQPNILLESADEVKNRIMFFMSLYVDAIDAGSTPERRGSRAGSFGKKRERSYSQDRVMGWEKEVEWEGNGQAGTANADVANSVDTEGVLDFSRGGLEGIHGDNVSIIKGRNAATIAGEAALPSSVQPSSVESAVLAGARPPQHSRGNQSSTHESMGVVNGTEYVPVGDVTQTFDCNSSADAAGDYGDDVFRMSRVSHARAKAMVSALLITYPSVLSNNFRQMRATASVLRSAGLRRAEIGRLVRRHPQVLQWDSADTQAVLSLLRFRGALKKADILTMLMTCPEVLRLSVGELEAKLDYLYESLDGYSTVLRECPGYLLLDLDSHIRPRAEFLRALGYPPLSNGLRFLAHARAEDIAISAKAELDLFLRFQELFIAKVVNKASPAPPMASPQQSETQAATSQQNFVTDGSQGQSVNNPTSQVHSTESLRSESVRAASPKRRKTTPPRTDVEDEITQRPFLDECNELDL